MSALPVITAMGGINAAGRSALHFGYQRLVIDALAEPARQETLTSLARLTGQTPDAQLANTLIRALPAEHRLHAAISGTSDIPITLEMRNMDLPDSLPAGWQVTPIDKRRSKVTLPAGLNLNVPHDAPRRVSAAGQLPDGFDPGALYASRSHPRALQMAIFGISDTLGDLGMDWAAVASKVRPDQVAVYASNAMSQMDDYGLGGVMRFPPNGHRITSKQVPLGLGEMTADFLNAYVLHSVGTTGGMLGACATFLYNLEKGVQAIRSGKCRVAIVGTSEAPLVAEIMEGYRAMGALAEDQDLAALDGASQADVRRACRPFSANCGFTMAESAQFTVLMDDTLALELGADILGAVPDVFIHADGAKKSISAPGVGNYLTMGKAAALTRQLIGERGLQQHSFVHAHGTGTPQNRVTESVILDRTAAAFGIENWPIVGIKSYVGHSLGSAGGDQLAATLGSFAHGILPGIRTIDHIADDVHRQHLNFCLEHQQQDDLQASLINSKGFGGNNATAVALSGSVTEAMLRQRHGDKAMSAWQSARDTTLASKAAYRHHCLTEAPAPVYKFNEGVMGDEQVSLTRDAVQLAGGDAMAFDDDAGLREFQLDR
ncbi:3-oxoacyl-ACP synthase [Alcanivorax sp. MD8A]|uniref:beta-ketoacyl synthase n=1 Tax=Alcanivorax sp. MD8A TaxID=1177157 RepID=UPI000C9B990B|nr:beta-ketoacyl synthase [Alcanivorax sp. MD8A]MED5433170.1 beta-ketoacyl synthase [Pseudomonadota bacterium]MEE2869442.1 beta-ketoacyl synthase [Pseudomonadota bacterium]PNE02042.1 3-oxoacyl-ACP synthase [Alcanivorax sp. MD8A]